MIKINIIKNGNITNTAKFDTQFEADEWLKDCVEKETFGKPEHQRELTPRIINKDGTITEATYETVPAEYEISITDITLEVEAERVKKETKHADRITRVSALKAVDFNSITTIAQLKAVVKLLVKESIKDDE